MYLALLGTISVHSARAGDAAVHALLFGSLDGGPSSFASAGVKVAPDGIDREGFAGLAVIGGGIRTERGPASPVASAPTLTRMTLLGAALGGYQTFYEWGVVGFFAGPEFAFESLMGSAGVLSEPTRLGLRLQGEVWARPTEDTLATATLILGSARWDLHGRVSAGYRLPIAYVGPEAAAYIDRTGYRKWSLGLHATEIALGGVTVRASAGCLYESEIGRFAPYVALASWMSL